MWQVSWRLNRTATYWPPTLLAITSFLPVLLGCSNGGLGPSLCWDMVLIPTSSLQLMSTSCRRGHITIWHPPTSCERHNSQSIQPLDSQGRPLISFRPDAPVIYTGAFLIWQLGRVGGQYPTIGSHASCDFPTLISKRWFHRLSVNHKF